MYSKTSFGIPAILRLILSRYTFHLASLIMIYEYGLLDKHALDQLSTQIRAEIIKISHEPETIPVVFDLGKIVYSFNGHQCYEVNVLRCS